jgi:replication factor C subunit 2/4
MMADASLRDGQRAAICAALAQADKCLVDGADEYLQLLHVASVAQQAICGTA